MLIERDNSGEAEGEMRRAFFAVTFVAAASPSLAHVPDQVRTTEVTVITGQMIDPAKLSVEERLAHVCQATSALRKHLQIRRNADLLTDETMGYLIRLSCKGSKSN
jgi:hypothetical protein